MFDLSPSGVGGVHFPTSQEWSPATDTTVQLSIDFEAA